MVGKAKSVPVKTGKKAAERAMLARGPGRDWHPLTGLRAEVDHLFDEFGRGFPFGRKLFEFEPFWRTPGSFGVASPSVDIRERDKEFEVTAELPGLDEKDIEVLLSNGSLTLKGEKKEEKEKKGKGYYLSERRYGAFERTLPVPPGVNAAKIAADFEKGVLTVHLPKLMAAAKKPRKVKVKSA